MNFGHIVGRHDFDNQWATLMHYAISWAPVLLSMAAGILAGIIYRKQIFDFVTERIQKNK